MSTAQAFYATDLPFLTEDPWHFCAGYEYLCILNTSEAVRGFLSAAPEADLDDPLSVDLAEYYLSYIRESGCTEEPAELLGMADIINEAREDPRLLELLDAGYPEAELYNETVRESDIRFSEVMDILEQGGSFVDILREAEGRTAKKSES